MGGKTMMVGVLDLGSDDVEPQVLVEARIRSALKHIVPERLIIAPDCGMKYLSRRAAFEKLQVMSRAASAVRNDLEVETGGAPRT
jgi:5-methyltetrahydropteroyltriglutamate--homocysteine methyltransferase